MTTPSHADVTKATRSISHGAGELKLILVLDNPSCGQVFPFLGQVTSNPHCLFLLFHQQQEIEIKTKLSKLSPSTSSHLEISPPGMFSTNIPWRRGSPFFPSAAMSQVWEALKFYIRKSAKIVPKKAQRVFLAPQHHLGVTQVVTAGHEQVWDPGSSMEDSWEYRR